ncbi:MAG: putative selenium-dependent hydroxylase accessory protein YqeC [Syntrophaceae bacterium]|nr:putative selenium-dependent hydroxylase accessory protein YqeC [Syntrophaceae bacterium]
MDPNQKVIHSLIEKFVKRPSDEEKSVGFLREALGLKAKEVISLVGAGGKTTFMFRLAKELFLSGKKVVTTTTTKILEPTSEETNSLFIHPDEKRIKDFIQRHLHQDHHITIALERLGSGKLKGISPSLVNELWNFHGLDTIIVEADGAAGRSIKAPREGEPVIPTCTTLVVAILGVDSVGKELNGDHVFQPERVSKMTGLAIGEKIGGDTLALLATHPEGLLKGIPFSSRVVVFLNKVDIPGGVEKGREISLKIAKTGHQRIERIVLGQLKKEPPVVEVIFP